MTARTMPRLASGPVPPLDLRALWAAGEAAFAAAGAAQGTTGHDFTIAERPIRVRCAGPASGLVDALSAVRAAAAAPPDLTILAWHGPAAWLAAFDLARLADPDHVRLVGDTIAVQACIAAPGWLMAYDAIRRHGLCWIEKGDALSPADRCRPFGAIINWWLAETPWQLVHAAAVAGTAGGVLLVGKGGTGKSTTALACVRAGWRMAGDDFVTVTASPKPRAAPLYASARLWPDMAQRFPELAALRAGAAGAAAADKHDFILPPALARRWLAGFALDAILAPHIGGARTALRPLSRGAALRSLAPSTLGNYKGPLASSFVKLAALAEALPCFRLDLGPDPDAIPAMLAAELDRVRTGRE